MTKPRRDIKSYWKSREELSRNQLMTRPNTNLDKPSLFFREWIIIMLFLGLVISLIAFSLITH